MTAGARDDVLDDVDALEAADPEGMLRLVASAGAQVRQAVQACDEAEVERLRGARPRAVVVLGTGASGLVADVLVAAAGPEAPVPVLGHRSGPLPRWVGASDVVVVPSASGRTAETLATAAEAARRGATLVAASPPDSPLADVVARARGVLVPTAPGRPARATLWSLAVPALAAADAVGVAHVPRGVLAETADRLDDVATTCRLSSESWVNPAKGLALALAGALPVAWGAGGVASVAATRLAGQLAENAGHPCLAGALPEAARSAVGVLDGRVASSGGDDVFRDRVEDTEALRLAVVLLRSRPDEDALATGSADAVARLAASRGVPVHPFDATGESRVERLASLVGVVDFASVYLAVALGQDPTPVPAFDAVAREVHR